MLGMRNNNTMNCRATMLEFDNILFYEVLCGDSTPWEHEMEHFLMSNCSCVIIGTICKNHMYHLNHL